MSAQSTVTFQDLRYEKEFGSERKLAFFPAGARFRTPITAFQSFSLRVIGCDTHFQIFANKINEIDHLPLQQFLKAPVKLNIALLEIFRNTILNYVFVL